MSSYLALDVGEKRIGVAVCDATAPFPAPLTTLHANSQLASQVASLLHVHRVVGVVVGYPRNQQGEATAQTKRVQHIVSLLNIPKEIPLYFQDESLTSVQAEAELQRRKKPYQKADIDALAATFILEDFIRQQLPHLQKITPPAEKTTKVVKKKKIRHASKKKKGIVKKLLLFSGIAVLLMGVGLLGWYRRALQPTSSQEHYQIVTVQPGSTSASIATTLAEKQIIRSKTAFLFYAKLHGSGLMQAGTYRLSGHQTVSEILATMASGKVSTVDILIAPGLRIDQIMTILTEYGYKEAELKTALKAVRNHRLVTNLPTDTSLEGYLFPDTYRIAPDTTAEQLLRTMLDTFQTRLAQDSSIQRGLKTQELSFEDAVIIASIVQQEIGDEKVQPTVAQVFLKRYREGIMLGSDVTALYGARVDGVSLPEDAAQAAAVAIEHLSPYNTRKFTGLPPGAISNFNLSALTAVANPTDTDYLYFVAGDDGTTYFSRTLEEHEAAVRAHCVKLCQ